MRRYITVDVDECEDPGICGDNSYCVNSVGSYSCPCSSGYKKTSVNTCQGNYILCHDSQLIPMLSYKMTISFVLLSIK